MIQILILVELFIDVSAFLKMFGTTFMVVHPKLLFLKKLLAQSMIQKMFGKVLIAGRKLVKLQSPYHCFISLLYSVVLFHCFIPLSYAIVLFHCFILQFYSIVLFRYSFALKETPVDDDKQVDQFLFCILWLLLLAEKIMGNVLI